MSVQMNQYIILGVKLPHNSLSYDETEDYEDNGYKPDIIHKNGIATLGDGMNGEYLMIGRIIEKAPIGRPLQGVFSFDPPDNERAELIAGLINLSFPSLNVEAVDIHHWVVTHYH